MRVIVSVPLLLSLALTGCLDTARVKRAPVDPGRLANSNQKTNVPGVPFYVKVGVCKQETTWLQPYYTLLLKKTLSEKFRNEVAAKKADEECKNARRPSAEEKPCERAPELGPAEVSIRSQVLGLESFQSPDVQQLRSLVSGKNVTEVSAAIEDVWAKIAALPPYSPFQRSEAELVSSKDAILLANKASAETMPDYSRMYYYNNPQPWIGTSTLDAHFNPDGTLTEVSSTVNSQTLQAVLSALPISSVLTSLVPKGPPQEGPFATEKTVAYELTMQTSAYTHTHSTYAKEFSTPCVAKAGGVTEQPYALSIEPYPPPSGAGAQPPAAPAPATTPKP